MVNIIADGDRTFIRGQSDALAADQLPPGTFQGGINVRTEQGILGPRWAFRKKKLNFVNKETSFDRKLEQLFYAGRYQALIPYSIGPDFYLIIIIAGYIYLVNQETFDVVVVEIDGGSTLNPDTIRINWTNAAKFLVIFDFPNRPVIIEGFSARRADPAAYEVPISTIGAYNSNRLFVGNAGNEFTGGDPVGNALTPDAPITFEEVFAPSAPYVNQVFQLTTNYNNDPITAMTFLQVADTGTGIGPLLVSTRSAVYAYQAQNPRADWEGGQFGTIYLYNAGIAGPQSLANVNSDIIFISSDGQVRSLSMARNVQQKWANVAMSRDVKQWFKYTDLDLAQYASVVYFRNNVFFTVNPYRVQAYDRNFIPVTDIAHGGLVALNLSNISSLSSPDSAPVWDGLWIAMRPMGITVNKDRMFAISKEALFRNELYECLPEELVDSTDAGKERPIRSRVYSRMYSFESEFQNKELHSIDLKLENVKGDLNLDLYYRPSHSETYVKWGVFKHTAPYKTCEIPQGCENHGFQPHSFKQINLGSPEDPMACDPVTREFFSYLRQVQLRFTIVAVDWQLHGYSIKAVLRPQEETSNVCSEYPPVVVCKQCNDDWAIGPFEKCLP